MMKSIVCLKVCYMHMVLTEFHQVTTKLIPNNIDLLTSTELSQYQITKWQLVYYDEGIW